MALTDPLVLRFAGDRPDEAAALLADSELGELAELIEDFPDGTAASVASRLPSWQLTGVLGQLAPEKLSRMIVAAPTDEAVAIISHLNESRYEALMTACPPEQQKALQRLLEFPPHSLAALATTQFIRVIAETPCGAFAEQLANSPRPQAGPVLAVDAQGVYLGMVDLQAVFARRNRTRAVGEIAIAVEPLNGLTEASTALTSRQWTRHTELPVVDIQHRLLGIVSHAAVRRVAGDDSPMSFTAEKIFSELATGYLNICARVLESAIGRPK
jgi:magnesium transporter